MNARIQTLASQVVQSLYPGGLLEVLFESIVLLLVAATICLLWRRTAAATRHLIWFMAVAALPLLLCLAVWPHVWPKPLWSVSKDLNSGNQVSLTVTLMPSRNQTDSARTEAPGVSASQPSSGAPSNQRLAARLGGGGLTLALDCWAGGAVLGLIWLAAGAGRLGPIWGVFR